MKVPKLKSFDKQMLEQGYRNVTGGSIDRLGCLLCFGKKLEDSSYIEWEVTDKCLAEPMREASLNWDIGPNQIEAVLITFGEPKEVHKFPKSNDCRYKRPYQVYVKRKD